MMHICVSKLTIIASDNGLSPVRRQAIIWTNAGILLIWTLGTNFSQFVIEIQTFSLTKIRLKMVCEMLSRATMIFEAQTCCYLYGLTWLWDRAHVSDTLLLLLPNGSTTEMLTPHGKWEQTVIGVLSISADDCSSDGLELVPTQN